MTIKDTLVPVAAIILIFTPAYLISYFYSEYKQREDRREDIRKELKSWAEVEISSYETVKSINSKCENLPYKENESFVNEITGGREKEISSKLKVICNSVNKKISGVEKEIDRMESKVYDVKEKVEDLKSSFKFMQKREINVIRRIKSVDGSTLYMITIPKYNDQGVVDVSNSSLESLPVGYSTEVMI